jgi:hypothetical protein
VQEGKAVSSSGKFEPLSTVLIRFSSLILTKVKKFKQAYMRILRLNWDFVEQLNNLAIAHGAKQLVYACNFLDTWFHGDNQYVQVSLWFRIAVSRPPALLLAG